MLIWCALLTCLLCTISVESACVRDTYSSLPQLPGFPSSQYSGALPASGSVTKNHWSQGVTLLRPTNAIVTTQTSCPHLGTGLKDWHDPLTWGTSVPQNNTDVTLPFNTSVLISSCSIDPTFVFGIVNIPATSTLIFGDAPISFQAKGVNVDGAFLVGSPTCRLRNIINITLHGKRSAQALPGNTYVKGISVQGNIDIHGVEYFPTWTRLAATANAGNSTIFIQDCPNWQPGHQVVVTTTEIKDSRDWHRNEQLTIASVQTTTLGSTVCAVTFTTPLMYSHYGGSEYQAEVALLSRNILIQGDPYNSEPTDTSPVACTYSPSKSQSTYPCDTSYLTGFGVHVIVQTTAKSGRFSGVEVYRAGQTNVLGRYPLHFHLLGNLTTPGNYFISDSSVHRSFFRCFTLHGVSGDTLANGITLTKNTAYDIIGHCVFASEDGVEENHTISYNFAGFIHPSGPYWQASYGVSIGANVQANGQSFYSQYTDYVTNSSTLARVDDLTASPFYFTNGYSSIIGNAASGGWSGYSFPNVPSPMGFFIDNTLLCPKNRPVLMFKSNSAHSTGFWQGHAAGVYLGGNMVNSGFNQVYTAGRYLPARDTCTVAKAGSISGGGGCAANNRAWTQFYDTKIFLANVGLQSWGDREEIIRFELHDVQLSTNVFGQVWIDQMLVDCRSNNPVVFAAGCNTTAGFWNCNARDRAFFTDFTGFQFYDTGQSHIVTNSIFQNCNPKSPNCNGGTCSMRVFSYLTHSDQFTPGLMQMTKNITYVNTNKTYVMRPSVVATTYVTVSGRNANWYDADGTVTDFFPKGTRVNIGSGDAGDDWWRFNDQCVFDQYNWICPMAATDSRASLVAHWSDSATENLIGTSYCSNGATNNGKYLPCPIGAYITHFNRDEANAFPVALMGRVSGPVITASGGWFIRYPSGTPAKVSFSDMQIEHSAVLHVAIPYPANTKFKIYAQAPTWCVPLNPVKPWSPICQHFFFQVNSIAEVRAGWGDLYYFDTAQQMLHLRLVAFDSFGYSFGTNSTYNETARWNSSTTYNTYFSRGGLDLLVTGSSFFSIVIEATNCGSKCGMPSVSVPGVNGSRVYTGPPQTPTNFTTNPLDSHGVISHPPLVLLVVLVLVLLKYAKQE